MALFVESLVVGDGRQVQPQAGSQSDEGIASVIIPTRMRRRGAETKLIIDAPGGTDQPSEPNPALVSEALGQQVIIENIRGAGGASA